MEQIADEDRHVEQLAEQLHSSWLSTLTLFALGRGKPSSWLELEMFLSSFAIPEDTIVATTESLLQHDLVQALDHGRMAGPYTVLTITHRGRQVVERIRELESGKGNPLAKILLTEAVQRRLADSNPDLSRKNVAPAIYTWVEERWKGRSTTP